jgi:citrate lyase subunit beta/citryl-CoA lyase
MPERSFLFVPGDRPERYAKALATPADRVIVDFEDAVLPAAKATARGNLVDWLASPEARPVAVRINGADTDWHEDDMRAVEGTPNVVAIVLPKAETRDALERTADRLGAKRQVIALMETVRGYMNLRDLARARGLTRFAFGSVDFCNDTGIRGLGSELDPIRTELVVVSRWANLDTPVEGVTIALKDDALLAQDIDRARRLGFGAKLCVHPSQVEAVNRGFSPTAEELDWATQVMATSETGGALAVNGKLVDRPVVDLARKILRSVL